MLALSPAAATFLLVLGFAVKDEHLEFARLSDLTIVVLVAVGLELRRLHRH